jgi:acetylornithine deacetylase/succinyl-diaminopimelate desuccinylase family protein
MKESILKTLEEQKTELLSFTKNLIEVPTENPPGRSYKECIYLIEKELNTFNLETEIIEIETPYGVLNPRYALISYFGEGENILYFHGHYDVVPASDEAQFVPLIKEGKLFGRGASDMKGGLAAMIYAVKTLKLCDFKCNGRICLVIVPDEETGGKYGTEYLFDKGIIRKGVGMLMPEPSGLGIWNACRGAISLLLNIKGESFHVTLKHRGVNAFENMIKVANELLKLKRRVEKRKTKYEVSKGVSRNSILMLGGYTEGGINFNIVPDEFSFSVDRRINPEEDLKEERTLLFNTINKCKDYGIELNTQILQEGESAGIKNYHPIMKILSSTVKEFTKKEPSINLCPGLLETRYYIKNGIPALAFGPGLLSVSHGPDEFVNVEDLYKCTAIYALTAVNLLSKRKNYHDHQDIKS